MAKEQTASPTLPFSTHPVTEVLAESRLDGSGALTHQVYRLLRDLIVGLRLLPNQFLSEKDVAASLKVSKTPVREAFIRLAEDGMVRIVPKSGTYVAPIDIDRAVEGFFIWITLEASCAGQAATRVSMGDLARLRHLLLEEEGAVRDGDVDAYARVNAQFHETVFEIADLADTRRLIESARFEVDRVLRLRPEIQAEALPDSHADHVRLVNAIARRDSALASAVMRRHLERLRAVLDSLTEGTESWELFTFLNRKRPGTRRSRR